MSDQINEAISALLDDSANELDIRRVLKQAQQSDSVAATARRYQLLSSLMKSEAINPEQQDKVSDSLLGVDLSASIAAAIEHEELDFEATASSSSATAPSSVNSPVNSPVVETPAAGAVAANDNGWMKQVGGLAVAASVAAFVVVGSQLMDQTGPQPGSADFASTAASTAAAERVTARRRMALVDAQQVGQGAEAQAAITSAERDARRELMMRQIEGYMQVHARHVSMNGSQGALPLARFADYK